LLGRFLPQIAVQLELEIQRKHHTVLGIDLEVFYYSSRFVDRDSLDGN
jgi:hypothetical protein